MPDNFLKVGGAGGIGAIIGSALTFFGFKTRIENLEDSCVTKDTCEVVKEGFHDNIDAQNEMLKEIREDIKTILRNGNT